MARTIPNLTGADLRTIATGVLSRRDRNGIVVLGTESNGKAALVAAAGADTDIQARTILTTAAREVGGGAGGKGPIASAGGRNPENLPQAITTAAAEARTSSPTANARAPVLGRGLHVGLAGFEPTTPGTQSRCATKLRYSPRIARAV